MKEKTQAEYITARIPVAMKLELEKIALAERRTKSQVVLLLLESALEQRNGKKK